jgi:transporter family protein
LSAEELTHEYSMVGMESSPLIPPQQRQLKHHHADDDVVVKNPPLSVWIIPALLCAMSYAFYNIFIKKGSASIHPVLGGVILQFVAAVLGVVLISLIIIRDGGTKELHYDWQGIQWSICAGIAVGLAEMISFFVSSLGVQAMQSIPIIIGKRSWWPRCRGSLRS